MRCGCTRNTVRRRRRWRDSSTISPHPTPPPPKAATGYEPDDPPEPVKNFPYEASFEDLLRKHPVDKPLSHHTSGVHPEELSLRFKEDTCATQMAAFDEPVIRTFPTRRAIRYSGRRICSRGCSWGGCRGQDGCHRYWTYSRRSVRNRVHGRVEQTAENPAPPDRYCAMVEEEGLLDALAVR